MIPGVQGDVAVALGYIRREAITAQREVKAGGIAATLTELPFSDLLDA